MDIIKENLKLVREFNIRMLKTHFPEIEIKEVLDPFCRERLSEKTYYRNNDGTYPELESCIGSDSLNSVETQRGRSEEVSPPKEI
jgi:hypothetical protein